MLLLKIYNFYCKALKEIIFDAQRIIISTIVFSIFVVSYMPFHNHFY